MSGRTGSIYAPNGLPARQHLAFGELRGYVAGDISGANQNFRPRRSSADADVRRGMRVVVDRCRDQAINNPSIRGAIRRIVNNVVRDGIAPQFLFRNSQGKLNSGVNKKWSALFLRWAAYAGLNRRQSIWSIQRLGLSQMWSDGEFYIHRSYDTSIPGIPPLRLELIERDMLDLSVDGELENGNIARQGKELDSSTGVFVAYHFLGTHPGDYQFRAKQTKRRILADDIIDVFEADRISQTMGMAWLAAVVMESFDLEDYRAYERIGAKLAAAFGVFVKNNNPGALNPLSGIGAAPGTSLDGEWPVNWGKGMPDYIEPGRIQALPWNTDIVIASHSRPGTQYEPYTKESRRTQSTGLGMSYEAFANDYTDASYSSARSGSLEERLSYKGMQFFLSERMLDQIVRWFIESSWISGVAPHRMSDFSINPYPHLESFVQLNPGWLWVDPRNDTQASAQRIEKVLSSHQREMLPQGASFDDVLEEAMDEETKLTPLYELRAKNARLLAESTNQGNTNA